MPTLTLLHTNDLHGRLDQMTRLGTLVQRQRALAAAEGRAMLLLDAGDSTDEAAWECRVTKGRANFAMLEAMGCDAAALGNTETQWDAAALEKLAASVHFPVLAANLFAAHSNQPPAPGVRSHAIFEFDGLTLPGFAGIPLVGAKHSPIDTRFPEAERRMLRPYKVAVIGVTVNEPGLYYDWGYRIESVETAARALVPRLRDASRGAQVVIVLSHEGVEADQQLAAAVMGIDAIIGGHSHTALLEPIRIGGTVIAQAGALGRYLGRLDLTIEDGKKITSASQLIPCSETVPPDPTLSGMLELVRFEAEVVRKKSGA